MVSTPTGGVLDRGAPAVEIGAQLALAQTQLQAVTVAVERDQMTLRRDLRRQRGTASDLFPDNEERRARPRARKDLEHGGRSFGVGPVVERQRDTVRATGKGARETERVSGAGQDGRQHVLEHASMIADVR